MNFNMYINSVLWLHVCVHVSFSRESACMFLSGGFVLVLCTWLGRPVRERLCSITCCARRGFSSEPSFNYRAGCCCVSEGGWLVVPSDRVCQPCWGAARGWRDPWWPLLLIPASHGPLGLYHGATASPGPDVAHLPPNVINTLTDHTNTYSDATWTLEFNTTRLLH